MRVASTVDAIGSGLVIDLVERLRTGGLAVSTSEVLDAVSSLTHMDLTARPLVRAALHATLVKDSSHEVLFRRSFDAVFPRRRRPDAHSAGSAGPTTPPNDEELLDAVVRALREGEEEAVDEAIEDAIGRFSGAAEGRSAGHHTQRVLRRMNVADLYRRYLVADQEAEGSSLSRAESVAEARSAMEQLGRRMADLVSGRQREGEGVAAQQLDDLADRPLLKAGADDLAAMRLVLRPLARRLAAKLGARRRQGGSGLDMRRTIRGSMGTGGVPVNPALRRRRPTKPDLLVLCDVSGSTAQFAHFTLTLLHAVHEEFHRVRTFVFIDGIVEISEMLESNPGVLDPHHLLSRRGLIAKDGRSDYARALSTFLATWGDAITAKSTVIVAGDARSHDREPATSVVAEIEHRARRLYWLNPEPRCEWDTVDSRASEYASHCTDSFEVSTIRQLTSAVTQIL